jgi:collagenase-like PrtC family protease
MRISLAPISGRYDADTIVGFYREAASCPDIARAYLGEMFCAKRMLPIDAYAEAVKVLEDGGKQAVFATMALPAGEPDLDAAARYVERVDIVEVNNLGYIPWLKENFPAKHLIAGPMCNLYNRDDLEIVRDWGCSEVSLRIDLMPESITDLSQSGILPVEVFLHGRPPLAFSWRCYAARFAGRPAGSCGRVCQTQNGLVLRNLEGEDGFVVDGPAVLSGQVVSTAEQAQDYVRSGAAFGRLWLEPGEVAPIAAIYAALLEGRGSVAGTREGLAGLVRGDIRFGPVARRRLS